MSRDAKDEPHSERLPFGATWRQLYAAVLINLAALIALFYLFTRVFS